MRRSPRGPRGPRPAGARRRAMPDGDRRRRGSPTRDEVGAGLRQHAERRAEHHAAERRAAAPRRGRGARGARRSRRRAASRSGSCPSGRSRCCRRRAARAPAAHSMIAAWKTSVPTTRCGVSGKTRISARPTSAPEPTRRHAERRTRAAAPSATAAALSRALERDRVALARDERRHEQRPRQRDQRGHREHARRRSTAACRRTQSPWTWCRCEIAARRRPSRAREPNASHFDTPMSTVPLRQWR